MLGGYRQKIHSLGLAGIGIVPGANLLDQLAGLLLGPAGSCSAHQQMLKQMAHAGPVPVLLINAAGPHEQPDIGHRGGVIFLHDSNHSVFQGGHDFTGFVDIPDFLSRPGRLAGCRFLGGNRCG
ncbi:MAG: hypothetical protein BWY71_01838 [Planctomycetes bacterium ADurb.Bin412]|nr:MAG: hypothetical protein BWY71_01838 [Planctomycetes bacterium ADurb.Bin412]